MPRGIPSHGDPEKQIFGLVGEVIAADNGSGYKKVGSNTLNIGWDVSFGPPRPTPTPTPGPSPTPTPTLTPTLPPPTSPIFTPTPTATNPVTPTPTPTPTPTAGPTPTPTPTPGPGPTPTPLPVIPFYYTQYTSSGWLYSPGFTGARYTNQYAAGFQVSGSNNDTTVTILCSDDGNPGGPFPQPLFFTLKINNSVYLTSAPSTAQFGFTFPASQISDGIPYNIEATFSGAPNSAIRVRMTIRKNGPAVFTDASFNVTGLASPPGIIDGYMALFGAPDGCTIPYVSIVDYTLGGYLQNVSNYYERNWELGSIGVITNSGTAYATNVIHPNDYVFVRYSQDSSFTPNFQGASHVELGASRLVPPNPSAPSYPISVVAGFGGSVTGGGTFTAGTLTPIVATDGSRYFVNWSSSGNGVNNLKGITNTAIRSTTTFVDGPKTVTATFGTANLIQGYYDQNGDLEFSYINSSGNVIPVSMHFGTPNSGPVTVGCGVSILSVTRGSAYVSGITC